MADADTTLQEIANDTEVQIEKGRQLGFTCSWPTPVEAALTSVESFKAMPNMEACAGGEIGSHVPLSLKQKNWAGNYINLALLTKGSSELQQFAAGNSFVLNERG